MPGQDPGHTPGPAPPQTEPVQARASFSSCTSFLESCSHLWHRSAQNWGAEVTPGLQGVSSASCLSHLQTPWRPPGVGLRDACPNGYRGERPTFVTSDESPPFLGLSCHSPSEGPGLVPGPRVATLLPHPAGHRAHHGAGRRPPPGPRVGRPGAVRPERAHQVEPPQLLPKGAGCAWVSTASARGGDVGPRAPGMSEPLGRDSWGTSFGPRIPTSSPVPPPHPLWPDPVA